MCGRPIPSAGWSKVALSSHETIRLEHEQAISWIVLDRPEHANALSPTLLEEFSAALEALRHQGAPVVGIRGTGKGFCAGMDLDHYGSYAAVPDAADDRARLQRNLDRWLAMWDHPKPIIAAVHGYCLGVAAQMCVFADITVVTHDARIGEPTVPIGGGFVAPTWVAQVGAKRAKEMAFIPGNWIDGRTAVEWGWANHSVEPDALLEAVQSLAERIALTPPEVLRMKKVSINRAAEAAGFRHALDGLAKVNSDLHVDPAVLAIRERIRTKGLKVVMAEYRVSPSTRLKKESA
jgi:enoyl-CoA hydratase